MKTDHGKHAEDVLENVSNRLIGPSFVLRSPQLIEEKGNREVADFLYLIDDTLVVVQSKSLEIKTEELDDVKFGRIVKRHEKALTQINSTLNAERTNGCVKACSSTGIEFEVEWPRVKRKIGIITLNIPDAAYEDPEFRFQFENLYMKHRGIDVHTFILRDYYSFPRELFTAGDFLSYLTVRAQCLSSEKFILGNELDFLAFYKCQYDEIDSALRTPGKMICVTPGYWEGFLENHKDEIAQRDLAREEAFLVDNLILHLQSSISFMQEAHEQDQQESALNYLTTAGMIAKMLFVQRLEFAKRIKEKLDNTKHRDFSYFAFVSEEHRIGYLFLASNKDDRELRKNQLEFMGVELCHQGLDCDRILCIGTSGLSLEGHSVDCIVLDVNFVRKEIPKSDIYLFKPFERTSSDEWSKTRN